MPSPLPLTGLMQRFRDSLDGGDPVAALRQGLVGSGAMVEGPFGRHPLVYADYTASGRALMQVEMAILHEVLPTYANTHTDASHCGSVTSAHRRDARAAIAAACGAGPDHAVIFCGAGATAGINRLVCLLGANRGRVRVILGPYEHHSNILPWRETGAEVVEIAEAATGGPDLDELAAALAETPAFDRVICAFSAASNVTGILTDVARVTAMVKAAGALVVWDYAGGGPYLPITMDPGAPIDAIVVSPHKFAGGPGASGVLILRRDAVVTDRPTQPGGGTVRFVNRIAHDYSDRVEVREEAGTPNVVGDIRAGLAFVVKDAIGQDRMTAGNDRLARRGLAALTAHPGIEVLGNTTAPRLPILSFRLRNRTGDYVHQQLVTRLLSDRFGIQARGGCACAGPYVHRLMGIGDAESDRLRAAILAGDEMEKPGFVRLNLSVLMADETVAFILHSIARLADEAPGLAALYEADLARAVFRPRAA